MMPYGRTRYALDCFAEFAEFVVLAFGVTGRDRLEARDQLRRGLGKIGLRHPGTSAYVCSMRRGESLGP